MALLIFPIIPFPIHHSIPKMDFGEINKSIQNETKALKSLPEEDRFSKKDNYD